VDLLERAQRPFTALAKMLTAVMVRTGHRLERIG
jgi:hypothetical protein